MATASPKTSKLSCSNVGYITSEKQAGTSSTTTKEDCTQDVEDMLEPVRCDICQDAATGFHYKCMTCEGCKGFFRRTVQRQLGKSYVCRTGRNDCTVDRENRGKCQACRFAKCLKAGMIGDLVCGARSDRLVKRLKVNVKRKRRKVKGVQPSKGSISRVCRSNPLTTHYRTVVSKAYRDCYEFSNNPALSASWHAASLFNFDLDSSHPFVEKATLHLTKTANFIERIPFLRELTFADRLILLGKCGLKVLLFHVTCRLLTAFPTESDFMEFAKEVSVTNVDVAAVYQNLCKLYTYVSKQSFEETESTLFAALLLSQSDECQTLESPCLVNSIQAEIENCILEHWLTAVKRHRDSLLYGNRTFAECVPLLFNTRFPLFVLDPTDPAFLDLIKYF